MRVERAVNYMTTLGPGNRLCVWVNGCSRGCKGCVSSRLQKIDEGTEVDIHEYFFGYNLSNIDGVTISGGEPFDQISELCRLVDYFRKRGVDDILVYTGYTYKELIEMKNPEVNTVLSQIAVLIDGPYIEELDDGLCNIKGSSNQNIYYLDPKVKEKYERYINPVRNVKEMTLGNVMLSVGIPDKAYIENFNKAKESETQYG